jgi:hypothetical protein
VPRYPGCFRNPGDHAVDVPAIDRITGERSQDQRAGGALAAAGLEDAQDRDRDGHGRGFVALADQVQHPVPAQGLGIVLDPDCGGLRRAQRVDAQQEGQCSVVDRDCLGDLEERD